MKEVNSFGTCPDCGVPPMLIGDNTATCRVHGKLIVPNLSRFEPVDVHPSSDAPLPDMLQRIDRLEALVKRIATHLGIEGGNE